MRKQSKDEEKYIKTFCLRHNIKCHLHRLEANDDANFQDYARRERYAFFDGVMKEINADYLLTGHQDVYKRQGRSLHDFRRRL